MIYSNMCDMITISITSIIYIYLYLDGVWLGRRPRAVGGPHRRHEFVADPPITRLQPSRQRRNQLCHTMRAHRILLRATTNKGGLGLGGSGSG